MNYREIHLVRPVTDPGPSNTPTANRDFDRYYATKHLITKVDPHTYVITSRLNGEAIEVPASNVVSVSTAT